MTGEDIAKSIAKQAQLEYEAQQARDREFLEPPEDFRLDILLWYLAAVFAITGACTGNHGGVAVLIDAAWGLVFGVAFLIAGIPLWVILGTLLLLVSEYTRTKLLSRLRPYGGGRLVFALFVTVITGSFSYVGLHDRRLVSADTHYVICQKPKTRVDYVYPPSNQCLDGWVSPSDGQGRCSYHGGVDRRPKRTETLYRDKSDAQCRSEAKDLSWID